MNISLNKLKNRERQTIKGFHIYFNDLTVDYPGCRDITLEAIKPLKPHYEVTLPDGSIHLNPKKIPFDWGTQVRTIEREQKVTVKHFTLEQAVEDMNKVFALCRYGKFDHDKIKKLKLYSCEISYGWSK